MILASALLLRDKRYHFVKYPGVLWGAPQIAYDVIRLKCRLLIDFLSQRASRLDDMIAADFGIAEWATAHDAENAERFRRFKNRVSPWTIRLSSKRATDDEYSKGDQQTIEELAAELMGQVMDFAQACRSAGIPLEGGCGRV